MRIAAAGSKSGWIRLAAWLAPQAWVLGAFGGLLLGWEGAVRLFGGRAYILPAPSVIFGRPTRHVSAQPPSCAKPSWTARWISRRWRVCWIHSILVVEIGYCIYQP